MCVCVFVFTFSFFFKFKKKTQLNTMNDNKTEYKITDSRARASISSVNAVAAIYQSELHVNEATKKRVFFSVF